MLGQRGQGGRVRLRAGEVGETTLTPLHLVDVANILEIAALDSGETASRISVAPPACAEPSEPSHAWTYERR
jgi:hypothetical protein